MLERRDGAETEMIEWDYKHRIWAGRRVVM